MTLTRISPTEAATRIHAGAVVVDIRDPKEYSRRHIPGARNLPLNRLGRVAATSEVIFHCESGERTAAHAGKLAGAASCNAFLLDGGIEAWRSLGLPVVDNRSQMIAIARQVQIAEGVLVLAGVILALMVSPALLGLTVMVGAALLIAGVSGWCGTAKLLAMMPWNRRSAID